MKMKKKQDAYPQGSDEPGNITDPEEIELWKKIAERKQETEALKKLLNGLDQTSRETPLPKKRK